MTDLSKSGKDKVAWEKWLHQYAERLHLEEEGVTDLHLANQERVKVMNAINPRFVLFYCFVCIPFDIKLFKYCLQCLYTLTKGYVGYHCQFLSINVHPFGKFLDC